MRAPHLRALSVSIALHVGATALVLALLWESTPPALFIDLTRPLDAPATAGPNASSPSVASSTTPAATASPPPTARAAAPRRARANAERVRPPAATEPSATSDPLPAPAVVRRAEAPEPDAAASPPSPTEVPPFPPPVPVTPVPAVAPSPEAPAPPGGVADGGGDAALPESGPRSTSAPPEIATFAPAPSRAGTGTGGDTAHGDQRGTGTAALAVPGGADRAGGEYGAYLALVRRRIQEALRYPMVARRRGLTGSVHVEITVEPSGTIAAVRLVTSSSHPLLDEAALEAVRGLSPVAFPPNVVPRSLRVRLPVVFELR